MNIQLDAITNAEDSTLVRGPGSATVDRAQFAAAILKCADVTEKRNTKPILATSILDADPALACTHDIDLVVYDAATITRLADLADTIVPGHDNWFPVEKRP